VRTHTSATSPGFRPIRVAGLAMASAMLAVVIFAGGGSAAGVTITIKNFQFLPTPAKVVVGQTVTFVNKDFGDHKIVFNDGLYRASPLLAPGQIYSVKMTRAGTVNYYDGVASFVTGTILVASGPAPTARPTPRPTPNATPKPTAQPAATASPKATTKPAATTRPSAKASPGASVTAAAVVKEPAGSGSLAPNVPTSSSGETGALPQSSGDSSGFGGVLAIVGLAALALLAGVWVTTNRRNRPPTVGAAAPPLPVAPVPPPAATPQPSLPAPVRRPVAGQPRRVERPTSEPEPSYPYDVDEDAPIEASRPGPRPKDEPFSDGL